MGSLLKAAHGGTLYLNRIEELTAAAQADLLAGLERRERSLGPIPGDGLLARMIASTREDLGVLVATGRFHEELYRRISNVEINLPPLRERADDIPLLAQHFVSRYAEQYGKRVPEIAAGTLTRIQEYLWPGNVEELKTRMRRAVEESITGRIETESVGLPEGKPKSAAAAAPARLQEVVEQHVFQVLKACSGNKVRAAEMLGISRSTLYRMLDTGLQSDNRVGLR
jgi:DNA-binding NtrC family response regulator